MLFKSNFSDSSIIFQVFGQLACKAYLAASARLIEFILLPSQVFFQSTNFFFCIVFFLRFKNSIPASKDTFGVGCISRSRAKFKLGLSGASKIKEKAVHPLILLFKFWNGLVNRKPDCSNIARTAIGWAVGRLGGSNLSAQKDLKASIQGNIDYMWHQLIAIICFLI